MLDAVSREEVHEALTHLYDDVELGQGVLVDRFPEARERAALGEAGARLRAIVLNAIETLRPSRRHAFGALESRSYDVLTLRYVENRSLQRLADELSLSQRQVHRDLVIAEQKLAAVLAAASARPGARAARSQLEDELLALRSQPTEVILSQAVQAAADLTQPLADRLGVRIAVQSPDDAPVVTVAERSLLTQVLAQLLSCAVQMTTAPEITVIVGRDAQDAAVALLLEAGPAPPQIERLADAKRIAAAQHWQCDIRLEPPGAATILLRLGAGRSPCVLVVEDNPGAVELYRRYLAAAGWRVHSLSDPTLAVQTAADLHPDAVILDVMMPGMDGWTLLRNLAANADTASLPVIVCSVVQDAQLSQALGARAHLCKPVSQGELLEALGRCLNPRGPTR
ncbi:MAG: response regulator [Anaerolineae bacterium]